MNEWVSMKDRPPPDRTEVIIWVECSSCRKGIEHAHTLCETGFPWHGIGTRVWYGEEHRWYACYGEPNITHWMLPEPPEVE